MKPEMLRSQFEALEEPVGALVMDIRLAPKEIVDEIIKTSNFNPSSLSSQKPT